VGFGRVAKNKLAWLNTQTTRQVSLHVFNSGEYDEENGIEVSSEPGPSYVLMMPVPGRKRPLTWNLSGMTQEELTATRQFFDHAFSLADPVTRERDQVANEAFQQGDDSYQRV
jgi:hypothetical protein